MTQSRPEATSKPKSTSTPRTAATTPVPVRVRVRMYRVGFGDCILLSVEYDRPHPDGRDARHVLFDFGSTRAPRRDPLKMADVAALIADHTGGRLDVVVVTHRHKDHIFGFGDAAAAATLTRLAPGLVVRPWTEDPTLAADATGPAPHPAAAPAASSADGGTVAAADGRAAGTAGLGAGAASRRFVAALTAAQQAAADVAAAPAARVGAAADLRAAAADQRPNAAAIATLDGWAAGAAGVYLSADAPLDLTAHVPGLTATVLGPPTLEQQPDLDRQTATDPEYWMLRLQRSLTAAAAGGSSLSAAATSAADTGSAAAGPDGVEPAAVPAGPIRWLVQHLASHRTHSVARLVGSLDDALNNTSVILLLQIGGLRLLFPGDAQIEDWQHTLDRLADDADLRERLTGIDLYKVGHHGSRNATPRSLHALWTQRPADALRMTALMSTLSGVHGDTPATAVPRQTLVDALRQVADLHSTEDLPAGSTHVEVVADATGGPFRPVDPPSAPPAGG